MNTVPRWLLLAALALPLALLVRRAGREAPAEGAGVWRLPPPASTRVRTVAAASAPVLPVTGIRDAVETADGWVVLDARSATLLWLDAEGRPLRRAGGSGQGPGEMANPVALAAWGDRLLVLETLGGPVHLFDASGRFVERLPPPSGPCPAGTLLAASGRGDAVFVLRSCPAPDGRLRAHLLRWVPGGATRPVHEDVVEDMLETLSPFRRPSAAATADGVLYGMAHDGCAVLLAGAGNPRTLCPAPEPRARLSAEATARARAVLEPRARAAGVRLVLPERAPAFESVAAVDGRPAFLLRPREGVLAVDLVEEDGRVRRVAVEGADLLFAGRRSLLAVREALEGPVATVVDPS